MIVMSTLLEYLLVVNPSLDRTYTKKGLNLFNPSWEELEGIKKWTNFMYKNLIAMLYNTLN